jgi:hypothetical protein
VALAYDEAEDYLYIITVHWLDPEKWEDPWRVHDIKVEIPATPLEPPDRSTSGLSAFINADKDK